MPNPPSRDELLVELRRQGLPAVYIERLLTELDEHARDLLEERNLEMSSNVEGVEGGSNDSCFREVAGDPQSLAAFSAAQYRQRTFAGRHPILSFVAAPLVAVVACFFGVGCIWGVLGFVLGAAFDLPNDHDYPYIASGVLGLISFTLLAIPPIVTLIGLVHLAARSGVQFKWPVIGCILTAALIACVSTSWRLSTAPGNGQFMLMLGVGMPGSPVFNAFILKFALFVSLGLLLLKRSRDRLLKPGSPSEENALRLAA